MPVRCAREQNRWRNNLSSACHPYSVGDALPLSSLLNGVGSGGGVGGRVQHQEPSFAALDLLLERPVRLAEGESRVDLACEWQIVPGRC